MAHLKSAGRRRVDGTMRRAHDGKPPSNRRFKRRDSPPAWDAIPPPAHAGIPMKKRVAASRLRAIALLAFCVVLLGVFNTHQRRARHARMSARIHRIDEDAARGAPAEAHAAEAPPADEAGDQRKAGRGAAAAAARDARAEEMGDAQGDADGSRQDAAAGQAEEQPPAGQAVGSYPDQIESVTRNDMGGGNHPVCRIANACILANGLLSLPVWMAKESKLLRQCGVSGYVLHTGSDGPKSSVVRKVDADLAQLIRLSRFKEPASSMAEFFSDSVLHAAFLFDTFQDSTGSELVKNRCISSATATDCKEGTAVPATFDIKPGMFVPRKVLNDEESWEAKSLSLFDKKYGADDLLRMEVDQVLDPAEKDKTSNVSATCFRSLIVAEGKLKELPDNAFYSTSTFFAKNSVERSRPPRDENIRCQVSIGILRKKGHRAIQKIDDLKEKIDTLASAALPSATVTVSILDLSKGVLFSEQVAAAQGVDVLIGGASNSLSHMSFMRPGGSVFEIFPFAWQPNTFGDMARVLGHNYHQIFSAPQTSEFKSCLEHEVLQLRKQSRIQGDETPDWVQNIEGKWSEAAAEFVLTGKSNLLLNSDTSGVSNYHTRACARRQSLDFSIDDLAKAALLDARNLCHPKAV